MDGRLFLLTLHDVPIMFFLSRVMLITQVTVSVALAIFSEVCLLGQSRRNRILIPHIYRVQASLNRDRSPGALC